MRERQHDAHSIDNEHRHFSALAEFSPTDLQFGHCERKLQFLVFCIWSVKNEIWKVATSSKLNCEVKVLQTFSQHTRPNQFSMLSSWSLFRRTVAWLWWSRHIQTKKNWKTGRAEKEMEQMVLNWLVSGAKGVSTFCEAHQSGIRPGVQNIGWQGQVQRAWGFQTWCRFPTTRNMPYFWCTAKRLRRRRGVGGLYIVFRGAAKVCDSLPFARAAILPKNWLRFFGWVQMLRFSSSNSKRAIVVAMLWRTQVRAVSMISL